MVGDESGQVKLYVIWRTLNFRRTHSALFDHGEYVPLTVSGAKAAHVCAFARAHESQTLVVIVPRLVLSLAAGVGRAPIGRDVWLDTRIVAARGVRTTKFENVFTGQSVAVSKHGDVATLSVAAALLYFPVALLKSD